MSHNNCNGFCRKPEYCPEKGVGFLLQDNKTVNDIWVHVLKTILKRLSTT